MNLAHPAALLWLGLALPIVVFYILKIRQRRVPVSTTLFWRQIFEEKQPRSLWEYLRHLLSLLIQVALLCLLVFALSEPFFRWEVLDAKRIVLVVDNSASMNATDGTPTRLAQAKEEGLRIIDALRFRDEMAIIAAGTQPQVRCGLTGHQRSLRAALESIPPTDGPTKVQDAVDLARRLLADTKNRKVIVLTDGCFPEFEALVKADDVELVGVGKKTGNVGITRYQVRRSLNDPIGYEILVEVMNNSEDPVECRLEIDLNGNVVDVVPMKLEASGKYLHVFEKTSAEGGRLSAKLNRADALSADNQAWALLPRRDLRPVTLVTDGDLFLEKVFQAIPLVKLSIAKEVGSATPAPQVTVLHRKVPGKLPPGPLLVIDPEGSSELWDLGEKLQNPIVTKQDKDSPLMAHVRLDNVTMPEARQLKPKGKHRVLATALSGDPLFCEIERPEGKVLVLTVNLDQSDLPLQTAFPILVTNALNWFSGNKGELRESLASGSVTEVDVPAKPGATLLLRSPDGQTRPMPSGIARLTLGPLDQCGVWSLLFERAMTPSEALRSTALGRLIPAPPGPSTAPPATEPVPGAEVACNLSNRQESDIRPPSGLKLRPVGVAAGYGGRPIWYYLIAMAWGLVGLEWYLYQRRWIS
jgi:von Willebrand factor type A domain/Aerotolerance regulator N-terminal